LLTLDGWYTHDVTFGDRPGDFGRRVGRPAGATNGWVSCWRH
jgi:hypothetical protein